MSYALPPAYSPASYPPRVGPEGYPGSYGPQQGPQFGAGQALPVAAPSLPQFGQSQPARHLNPQQPAQQRFQAPPSYVQAQPTAHLTQEDLQAISQAVAHGLAQSQALYRQQQPPYQQMAGYNQAQAYGASYNYPVNSAYTGVGGYQPQLPASYPVTYSSYNPTIIQQPMPYPAFGGYGFGYGYGGGFGGGFLPGLIAGEFIGGGMGLGAGLLAGGMFGGFGCGMF